MQTNNQKTLQENQLLIPPGIKHPSGITDEGELAYVSAEFWMTTEDAKSNDWDRLLAFQRGWQACKKYYKITI